MLRSDALRAIYPELERCVVVTIMGATAVELQEIGHRPHFFYLQHAMGLASSMGLGMAIARPELQVVVIDGDGSLLMNLGTLTTLARYRPSNLIHVVFDNESLLSVGGFPTATSAGSNLAKMASGAGIEQVCGVTEVEEFRRAFCAAVGGDELSVIVAKVEAVWPSGFVTDLPLLENRFEFKRWMRDGAGK